MNEEIKKNIPEELAQEELSMVTGGNSPNVQLSRSDSDIIYSPPATDTVTNGSPDVVICSKCRQRMSIDKLYSKNGNKYCSACLSAI